ncbi:MAG: hypothetical protein NT027_03315 [Proteobacteria bacterium]|nr:hypothetical protein [Pseudomonadota bacterium]
MKMLFKIVCGIMALGSANFAQAAFKCSGNSQIPLIELKGESLKGVSTLKLTLSDPNTGTSIGPLDFTWSGGSSLHSAGRLTQYSGFFYGNTQENVSIPSTLFLMWWAVEEVDEPQFLLYNTQNGDPKYTLLNCFHVQQ